MTSYRRRLLAFVCISFAISLLPREGRACSICQPGDPLYAPEGTSAQPTGAFSFYVENRHTWKSSGALPDGDGDGPWAWPSGGGWRRDAGRSGRTRRIPPRLIFRFPLMQYFEKIAEMGHEQVVFCHDKASGYRGIIAIHDTTLGPALGGCRFWHYATEDAAIVDALRLSRGMTYKNAVAGLNLGGGKSVIIGDNKTTNREMLFRAHGRFVDSLGGRYVTAEDVGTTVEDMDFVHMETKHVTGIGSKSGDPSSVTAHGVFRAIQASAFQKWGSDSLEGRTIAIQGLGHVGYYLAKELHAAGAKLIVTDIDAGRIKRVVDEMGATAVALDEIYRAKADVFTPCALGGILNDDTIPQLAVEIVAGAAESVAHRRRQACLARRGRRAREGGAPACGL